MTTINKRSMLWNIIWAIITGLATGVCINDAIYSSAWWWILAPFLFITCLYEVKKIATYDDDEDDYYASGPNRGKRKM